MVAAIVFSEAKASNLLTLKFLDAERSRRIFYAAGSLFTPTGDITMYAIWDRRPPSQFTAPH